MKLIFVCIIVACCCLPALSTPFLKCDQNQPAPTEVRVDGCTKLPCSFYRGTNVTSEWDFVVERDTEILKPQVRVTIGGATIPYPFPQSDACVSLKNAKCPLDAGEKVTYQLSMPIEKVYPKIQLTIEFAFLDQNKNVVVCYKLPAQVVDK